LKQLAPALWVCISACWERGYKETHSSSFTKAQLREFHINSEKSPNNIFMKCYSVIATSFAARSSEVVLMTWSHLHELIEEGSF